MNQLNISKARESIKSLVQEVTTSGEPIVIASRNRPAVILVPYDTYKFLATDHPEYNYYMAAMFAKRFLFDAPMHMIASQIKEFEKLTPLQLCAFIEIESLPIPSKKRKAVSEIVGNEVVQRLEKRKEIADHISKARREGLYENEEHKTGLLRL